MSDIIDQEFLLFASKASRLLDAGESEKALHLCEAGVKRFPFYGQGHFVMGLCYQALSQPDNAKDEFERTLFFEPAHTGAMRRLAQLGADSGFTGIANEWLLKTALYTPNDEELIDLLREKGIYGQFAGVENATKTTLRPDKPELGQAVPESAESLLEAEAAHLLPVDDIPPLDLPVEPQPVVENTDDEPDELILTEDGPSPEGDVDPADRFDPLAGEADLSEIPIHKEPTEEERPKKMDLSSFAQTNEDFSSFMDDYLDGNVPDGQIDKDISAQDEWLEVDDLIVEEQVDPETDVEDANVPEGKGVDETRQLLEELSMDDADIDFSILSEEPEEPVPTAPVTDMATDMLDEQTDGHLKPRETEAEDETAWNEIEPIDVEKFEPAIPAVSEDDDDDVTIDKLMKNPNLVTPTFGEILIAQRKFNEARHVFSQLAQREPDNPKFTKKIRFLDKFLEASKA